MLRTLAGGGSQCSIAKQYNIDPGDLSRWISADDKRSARVNSARALGATYWDEQAEDGIAKSEDAFELAKAKELAHHYRWRASKLAPAPYGNKLNLTGTVRYESVKRTIIDPAEPKQDGTGS